MAYPINSPYAQFTDGNGDPLENGYIWIGTANLDAAANPITVYWDAAATIPAAQPIRTLNGFPVWNGSPANIYVTPTSYSIKVLNKNGSLVFSRPNVSDEIISSEYVTFLQAGSGAVATTVQTKFREGEVSVWDFMSAAQQADVLAGTLLVDTLDAFQKAIASFSSFGSTFQDGIYSNGGTVLVPPGKYYLSDTLEISKNIHLTGVSNPQGYSKGMSRLFFADNVDGIYCPYYTVSGDGKLGRTKISNLWLQPKNATSTTLGTGVRMRMSIDLDTVVCYGWGEHGFSIMADLSWVPPTGANCWSMMKCNAYSCKKSGFYVEGSDANAGVAIRCTSIQMGEYGFCDKSGLGNTYIGCDTSNCTLGAYYCDGLSARNVFLGCYAEATDPVSQVPYSSMAIGGIAGTGYSANSNYLQTADSYGFRARRFSADVIAVGYNVTSNSSTDISVITSTTSVNEFWKFQRDLGTLTWRYEGSGGLSGLVYYDRGATVANGFNRNALGLMGFVQGFALGPNARLKIIDADVVPSSGTWVQGDFVMNRAPSELGTVGSKYIIHGWRCVSGGTPGTWVQVRTLTGN